MLNVMCKQVLWAKGELLLSHFKAHIEITNVYGREEAHEVIMTSVEDYKHSFY